MPRTTLRNSRPMLKWALPALAAIAAAAPAPANAEPSPNKAAAEGTVESLFSLLVGDFDTVDVTCVRAPDSPGTWACNVRWTARTDPWTKTVCRSVVINAPEEVGMDDTKTTCKPTTRAQRARPKRWPTGGSRLPAKPVPERH